MRHLLIGQDNLGSCFNKEFKTQNMGYTYYIDATTGEIIGGEDFHIKGIKLIRKNGVIVGIKYVV